jgi:hypothetical protein
VCLSPENMLVALFVSLESVLETYRLLPGLYRFPACFFIVIIFTRYIIQQSDIYDLIDQATLLRQEQLLKSQSLQAAASLDGATRYFIS